MIKIEKTELYKKTEKSLSIYWDKKKADLQYEFCIGLIQYASGKYYDYKRARVAHTTKALEAYRKTNKTSSKAFQFQRLLFGYRIDLTPTKTNLSSVEANKKEKPVVKDHIIGTSLIGFYVVYEFKNILRKTLNLDNSKKPFEELAKENYDGNWFEKISQVAEEFSKDWLKHHLCLWSQCRITTDEHSKENLVRGWGEDGSGKQKLNQLTEKKKLEIILKRLNLSHYKKTKKAEEIKIVDYRRKRI